MAVRLQQCRAAKKEAEVDLSSAAAVNKSREQSYWIYCPY